ncbi:MAG TPA: asparagine synthase-related protein, partial [Chroococcidiopsis sp.]
AASAAGFERSLPLYDAEFIQRYTKWNPYQQLLQNVDLPQQLHGREPVHQSMYLWSKSILANYIFKTLGDGVEMAHSIEGRVPFLDHELVEIACQIPAAFKIHGIPQNQIRDKYVLREATRPVVTDTIYQRQKHPFLSPPSTLKPDGALHEFLQDTLRGQSLRNLGFYNPAAVVKLLDQIPEMRPDQLAASELLLMRILSSCVLQERFGLSISS